MATQLSRFFSRFQQLMSHRVPLVAAGNLPPNGGWLAWLQVVAGFLVIFNAQ